MIQTNTEPIVQEDIFPEGIIPFVTGTSNQNNENNINYISSGASNSKKSGFDAEKSVDDDCLICDVFSKNKKHWKIL